MSGNLAPGLRVFFFFWFFFGGVSCWKRPAREIGSLITHRGVARN